MAVVFGVGLCAGWPFRDAPLAASNGGPRLVALAENNVLVRFEASRPGEATTVAVTKVGGSLVGIDYRPSNGKLFALSGANDLYTIDPDTGVAARVCTLTLPFDGGTHSGFDFNPQSDRLRLVSSSGQNLRVHPDLGATATDGSLAYARKDRNFGKRPQVGACAYTNSVAGAASTRTFDIDAGLDVLVLQEPPNDGQLTTVGSLGADFEVRAGFDILTSEGEELAFAVSGGALYSIDLKTGAARHLGMIGQGTFRLIGLAVIPTKR